MLRSYSRSQEKQVTTVDVSVLDFKDKKRKKTLTIQ